MASSPVTTQRGEQKRRARYTRTVVRAKVSEAVGGDVFDYSPDDEHYFEVPHPLLYSEATRKALKAAGDDDKAQAKAILGDQYDAFVEAGGYPEELTLLQIAISTDTRKRLANGGEDDDEDPTAA